MARKVVCNGGKCRIVKSTPSSRGKSVETINKGGETVANPATDQSKLSWYQKLFNGLKNNAKYAMGPASILIKSGVDAARKKDLSTASQIASGLLGPAGLIGVHGQEGVQSLLENTPGGGAIQDILKDMGWNGGGAQGGAQGGGMPADLFKFQKYAPDQVQAMSQQLQSGLQGLNPQAIEGYARQQFQQNTVPGLAERFTSLGGQNRLASSGFGRTVGAAGSHLEGQLAGLRSNIAQGQIQSGLQPQFEALRTTPQANWLDRLPGLVGAGVQAAPWVSKLFTGGI